MDPSPVADSSPKGAPMNSCWAPSGQPPSPPFDTHPRLVLESTASVRPLTAPYRFAVARNCLPAAFQTAGNRFATTRATRL